MNTLERLLHKLLEESRAIYKTLPKVSVYNELLPYKNKEGYYISFTDVEKIGINPKSKFETPLGIYTYPLKQSWIKYKVDETKDVGEAMPFAGERENIYLLKKRDGIKFINSAKDYTDAMLEKDMLTLMRHVLENKESYYKSFGGRSPEQITPQIIRKYFKKWKGEAYGKEPVFMIWNITRELSGRRNRVHEVIDKKVPTRRVHTSMTTGWNTLLYKVLGYYGFSDSTGAGYIHNNEPIQTVFFTKRAFTVVKLSPNKEGKREPQIWYYPLKKAGKIRTRGEDTDATVGNKEFVWNKGEWINGTWEDGYWFNGTWHDGTWKSGIWSDGEWLGGRWKSGDWLKGTWKGGVWEHGNWGNGNWHDGTAVSIFWIYGTWHNGLWNDGTWVSGTWKGGTWKKGLIYDPDRIGNFKEDWAWTPDKQFVHSPINPAEYFKDKDAGRYTSRTSAFRRRLSYVNRKNLDTFKDERESEAMWNNIKKVSEKMKKIFDTN